MSIHRVGTIFQRREVATLHRFFKRRLQPFSRSQKIQRLRVARILLHPRFGEQTRLAR